MNSSAIIDRRGGQPRVIFEQAVQVLPAGSQQTIWARAANLSESGIFVSSAELFGVGTEIDLRLPLPAGEGRLDLRGRVVRVSQGSQPGMGIAFDGLDEAVARELQRALTLAQPAEWVRPAKVWFAGTSQPTRVQASMGPDGLRLFCDLGFLRLGEPVTLFFADEEERNYTGVLQSARLQTDTEQRVPRLELSLSLDEPLPDAGQTWTYWPPPPVRGAEPAEPPRGADPTLVEAAAVEPGEPEDPTVEVVIEAAPEEPAGEIVELTQGHLAPFDIEHRFISGSIDAPPRSSPEVPREPSVQVPSLDEVPREPSVQVPSLDEASDAEPATEGLDWDVSGLPAAARSHWSLRAQEVPLPQRRRRRWRRAGFWMWLLALSMAGLTVASMTYTKLWERVRDRLLPAETEPRVGALLPAEAPPLTLLPPAVEPGPKVATGDKAAAQEPDEADNVVQVVRGEEPPSDGAPSVETDRASLTIPIEGSLAGARQYVLANPDGVAVNLPNARPRVAFGNYQVQRAGFRVIWVRHRVQGGLHLRVLHDPGSVAEVKLTPEAVHVTLKPATPPAPPEGDPTP